MKISKILFLFIFFANYSLAGVWSHMGIDGIDGAYSSINASISVREEAVRAIWASQINPLLPKPSRKAPSFSYGDIRL